MGQQSNLELLRNFLFQQPQLPNYNPQMPPSQEPPERGKYVNMNELLSISSPVNPRPPIPQEFMNMPTDQGVSAYRNQLYPTLTQPPTLQSPIEPQRNETLTTPQTPATSPQTNRNNLLMAALFGGVAPALAAAFGGETGLAAGSGMAQGFGTQYAKGQEFQQKEQYELAKEKRKESVDYTREIEKEQRAELKKVEEEALKEGFTLDINKDLPLQEKIKTARTEYISKRQRFNNDLAIASQKLKEGAKEEDIYRALAKEYPDKILDIRRFIFPKSFDIVEQAFKAGLMSNVPSQ
jgi:hypothetical protein